MAGAGAAAQMTVLRLLKPVMTRRSVLTAGADMTPDRHHIPQRL